MARGKLTMKRCPNGKVRKCPKKHKKCSLKSLNPKARTFRKNKLNPKAKSFKMGGKKHKDKKVSSKSKKTGGKKKSSYNIFMSEELKRIKKKNPKMDHKKAFQMAAKNWKK